MSPPSEPMKPREARLNDVLAEYLDAVAAGKPIDRAAFLSRHADLEPEISALVADRDRLDEAARRLACPSDHREAPTLAPMAESPSPPALASVRYFGDYELLDEIARGGMGVIYRAHQASLNRVVALKMILAGQLASADDVGRFRTEAEAVANLDHPNIVPIYEVGERDGQHYFSMKLIEGSSLARNPRIAIREVVGLMVKVARAVHHAHQRGILHRDLKPGNILVDQAGEPHVTDFGLAKQIQSDQHLTQSGSVIGTPSYMAPEQARAEKSLTTAADIYSLGAILYELLTCQPPFRGATPLDTILQVLDREPERPTKLNPGIPPDLETITLKCLEKSFARRYLSAGDLAQDLERWLQGEPIAARPATRRERLVKWARRRPAVAALLVVSVLGFFTITWNWWQASVALEEAEANLYANRISLAYREWTDGNYDRARDLLAAAPRPRRDWEWDYINRLLQPELRTLRPGLASLNGLACSPDGRTLLAIGSDTTIRLLDLLTGERLHDFSGHRSEMGSVGAFSPDGTRIATAHPRFPVRLWDTRTGMELSRIETGAETPRFLLFSPDGKRLLTKAGGNARVYATTSGEEVLSLESPNIGGYSLGRPAAFHPDGTVIAVAQKMEFIKLFDATTGKELRSLARTPSPLSGLVFAPDGNRIATANRDFVYLWDTASGKEVLKIATHSVRNRDRTLYHEVTELEFSPDGKLLATAGGLDRTIRLWDTATGQERCMFAGHTNGVSAVAFLPNGTQLASASTDTTIKLWDLSHLDRTDILRGHKGFVHAVAFHPDHDLLASGGKDKTVRLWNTVTRKEQRTLQGHGQDVLGLAFHPHGKFLASVGGDPFDRDERTPGEVLLWDLAAAYAMRNLGGHSGTVRGVAFSPDGKLLATAGSDKQLILWDPITGNKLRTMPLYDSRQHKLWKVAFSADSRLVAATDHWNGRVCVWETDSGKPRGVWDPEDPGSGTHGTVKDVAFCADGSLAAANYRGATIWHLTWGFRMHQLRGQQFGADALAFSAGGKRLATVGADLRLWDLQSGQELLRLDAAQGSIQAVAFDREGRRIATAGTDGTVRLWDAERLPGPPDRPWRDWLMEHKSWIDPAGMIGTYLLGVFTLVCFALWLRRWMRRRRALLLTGVKLGLLHPLAVHEERAG